MIDAVYTLLSSNTDLTDVVGSSIYPYIREEETDMPALMMEITSIQPVDTNSGAKVAAYNVDVHSYSQTALQANALMMLVRSTLDRVEAVVNTYDIAYSHVTSMDADVLAGGRVYTSTVSVSFHINE